MSIAVIGTGNMGAGLARLLAGKGLEVVIGARDPAKAAALAAEIGANVQGGGIAAAFRLADIVILALPFGSATETFKAAGDTAGKILIDISNPLNADFQSLAIGHTTSAAEQIQALAPKAKVVKAFNTIFAQLLPAEARTGKTLQVFTASDDADAKAKVSTLIGQLGFEAVDAGALASSRELEPIGMMNIRFGFFLGKGTNVAPMWVKV
jgi:8-hydroxy-5-deazaflavin:NADPH oxidoreductase